MIASETVLFAIRGALKLGMQARAAYVDATRRRALVLPILDFQFTSDVTAATSFFLANLPEEPEQLVALVHKAQRAQPFTPEEEVQLLEYHSLHKFTPRDTDKGHAIAADGSVFEAGSLNALVAIRQWERGGDPNPSTLKRMAGTLVEIGVDYFLEIPGALDTDSAQGRAIKGFLEGLDTVDFTEADVGELPRKLFVAAIESIAENPDLFTDSEKSQTLIRAATKGLIEDVAAKISELRTAGGGPSLTREEQIVSWGEVVFRSLLSSTGQLVIADPARYLDVDDPGESTLITGVGTALINAIADTNRGELRRVFSVSTLESVTDAALLAVAQHPELVDVNNPRLGPLITQIATDLAGMQALFARNALPEATRLILRATGDHLELLWPPGQAPDRNLALIAVKSTLETLTQSPPAGSNWSPKFTEDDLEVITSSIVYDLVSNPGWLKQALADSGSPLKGIVEAVVNVLREKGDQQLLTRSTAVQLVSVAMTAAATQSGFVKDLPTGDPFIAALIDAMLSTAFGNGDEVAWRLAKEEFLVDASEALVELLASRTVDDAALTGIRTELDRLVQKINNNEGVSLEAFINDVIMSLEGGQP